MNGTHRPLECDLLIVGGGINGAGIARDAAGRGLSVLLCEKDDLAAHTSSASTKLIHGGLRYLEQRQFGLVRKALNEREVLLRSAPHIARPLRFVMPHDQGQRPAWMIRAGLFLYDRLARRDLLGASAGVDLRRHTAGLPLKAAFGRGFMYSDGWVDDARLVVLNAMDAAEKGARILTRTRCETARRGAERWQARLRTADGAAIEVSARCLVNATGPWAAQFLRDSAQQPAPPLRLVKGSHIVVKRLFEHPYAYLFQHPDGRAVFALPYERDFTLIGTTDLDYAGDPDQVRIEADEIDYLCRLSNRYFERPIGPADVVWSFAGVRPLLGGSESAAARVTRDYQLAYDGTAAPLLSVLGGKITTYRRLAEEALDLMAPALSIRRGRWTAGNCLPGGDLCGEIPANRSVERFDYFIEALQHRYAWLPSALVARYAHAYGTRTAALLARRDGMDDMGEQVAPGLYAAELEYLMDYEWAAGAEDVLWRRSKLGLHLPAGSADAVQAWMAARCVAA